MAIPLELLLKDQAPLVSVNMSDPLTIAISLMREHEFSQLPVVEGTKPLGLVTGDSIARALFNLGTPLDSLHVSDAVLKSLTFTAEDELLDVVDSLMLTAAVLIVDPQGDLKGIITNYDTIQFFRSRAEDIMRLEDIETTLRQHIRAAYPEKARWCCQRGHTGGARSGRDVPPNRTRDSLQPGRWSLLPSQICQPLHEKLELS